MGGTMNVLRRMPIPKPLTALFAFGWQQALSCVFPVCIFAVILLTKVVDIPVIPEYDFVLLVCILVQWGMVRWGLETMDELKVICVFHLIGLALEIYKIHMGSWAYPQESWTKVFGVPLYSGFMYASVASYLCQAWRRMNVRLQHWPRTAYIVPMGAAIYLNFMTHHYIPDLRWMLTVLLVPLFRRTYVDFDVLGVTRRMHVLLSFLLIGWFIWLAENMATFLGAWQYPDQRNGWSMVHLGKLSSWFLLVIVSFMIVAQLKHVKKEQRRGA
ncbi:DUF817 domain-containing protein [Gorillibacterium sp. sgz5001074]|uniref:DUF817 domain-containing protein n=1 Tax=Gorillibacterium sp. sgz5001074 TaxID=3446695 RepID=UPI003F6785C7